MRNRLHLQHSCIKRRLSGAAALAAVVVLAASCGGSSSSSSNGEASKPPTQILRDAQNSTASAASVHVAGTGTTGGTPFSIDVVAGHGAGGGTVGESGATFHVIFAGGKVYVRADAQSLQKVTNSAAAARLFAGRWLTSASNQGFSELASLVDISKLPPSITPGGKVSVGRVTKVNGASVIPLHDSSGGTLYVAATGKPYMIAVRGSRSGDSGLLNFDQYNTARPPAAPTGAVNLDQLKQSLHGGAS